MTQAFIEAMRAPIAVEVKARTKIWSEKYGYSDPIPVEKKTAKALAVEKTLGAANLGAKANAFATLAGLLIDEPVALMAKPEVVAYFSGCAVTPITQADNSHNYTLNKATVNNQKAGSDYFLKPSGQYGNHMTASRKYVRPSTDAEIDEYFKELTSEALLLLVQDMLQFKVEAAA